VTETLLLTKLRIPQSRPQIVPRPRLIAILDQTLQADCRLALISAPAGFGKTVLLSEWANRQALPVAYLSLEEGENDLKRFLAYFVAALQTAVPTLGQGISAMLRSPEAMAAEPIMTALINEIAGLGQELLLILDDLHLVSATEIYAALAYLLEHMPPDLHFLLATRADPPLPLARLRARGQMIELREADLRFTQDETAHFLQNLMALQLGPDEVHVLHSRTEGWAAGLQMAALSMRGREHLADFARSFSGSHEYVVDYLTDEVLARQRDAQKTFLLQTSILGQLCGPLCDAVTGQVDSHQRLEQLKADNLFTLSLDDERHWYRYHRLFADLLQQRLLKQQPDQIPELHRRASNWLAENGFPLEAIHHALQAGDGRRGADLIEGVIEQPATWNTINATMLMAWLERLPAPILQARPRLRLYQARAYTVKGYTEKADVLLQALEEKLRQEAPPGAESDSLLDQIAADRVSNAILRGQPRRAVDFAEQALAEIAQDKLPARLRLETILGLAYYQVGDVKRAAQAYARAAAAAQVVGVPAVVASLKTGMAKVNILRGRLREAAQDCAEACQLAEVDHVRTAAAGPALVTWAEILSEQNELQQAQALLGQGIELLLKHGPVHALAMAYVTQARIQQAKGQYEEALQALRQAAQLAAGQPGSMTARGIAAQRARLWLATNNLVAAEQWSAEYRLTAAGEYTREFEELTLARVYLARERADTAISLLATLLAAAEQAGRLGSVIEILVLQALALAATTGVNKAIPSLARSLALAEPQGYARLYIDEGQSLARLLAATAAAGHQAAYAHQLLQAMPLGEQRQAALVEPLSQREMEVLQLIEQGLSNRQIAQELVISLATVKSHTGHIYSKLGVSSRTQAVGKARALHLL
jgi:LuxR family maltose regulon positive regulatory protein